MAQVQTTYAYPRKDNLVAESPDDGGHQGSYTQPQDMLIQPQDMSLEPENTGQRVGAPMLQYTNAFPKRRVDGPVTGLLIMLAALVLGLVMAFWITMM